MSNLRRRSGKHFLKSPQRFLPLLVFFSKKVKWVHLRRVDLNIRSHSNREEDFICLNLGVAKQSCWHLPLVAIPTFDCSISYLAAMWTKHYTSNSITSPTLVSSLFDLLGSQSLRWKTLQDTTCNIFLDSEEYYCEDDWDWIIDVVSVRIFRTISYRDRKKNIAQKDSKVRAWRKWRMSQCVKHKDTDTR